MRYGINRLPHKQGIQGNLYRRKQRRLPDIPSSRLLLVSPKCIRLYPQPLQQALRGADMSFQRRVALAQLGNLLPIRRRLPEAQAIHHLSDPAPVPLRGKKYRRAFPEGQQRFFLFGRQPQNSQQPQDTGVAALGGEIGPGLFFAHIAQTVAAAPQAFSQEKRHYSQNHRDQPQHGEGIERLFRL